MKVGSNFIYKQSFLENTNAREEFKMKRTVREKLLQDQVERLIKENNILKNAFNHYDIIKSEVSRSKIRRVDWKKYFGSTLTKTVAGYYALGLSCVETFILLSDLLAEQGVSEKKVYENLKIGVSSRYAEIQSESNTIKKTKEENKNE